MSDNEVHMKDLSEIERHYWSLVQYIKGGGIRGVRIPKEKRTYFTLADMLAIGSSSASKIWNKYSDMILIN